MQRQSLQRGAMIFIEAYKKIDFFTDFSTRNLAFDTLLRYTENKSRWFWYIFCAHSKMKEILQSEDQFKHLKVRFFARKQFSFYCDAVKKYCFGGIDRKAGIYQRRLYSAHSFADETCLEMTVLIH